MGHSEVSQLVLTIFTVTRILFLGSVSQSVGRVNQSQPKRRRTSLKASSQNDAFFEEEFAQVLFHLCIVPGSIYRIFLKS